MIKYIFALMFLLVTDIVLGEPMLRNVIGVINESDCHEFYYNEYNDMEAGFASQYSEECAIRYMRKNLSSLGPDEWILFSLHAIAYDNEIIDELYFSKRKEYSKESVLKFLMGLCLYHYLPKGIYNDYLERFDNEQLLFNECRIE